MSDLVRHTLAGGLTLVIEELDRPAAATCLLLPGGSAIEPAGQEGAGQVLTELMERGAGGKSSRELAEAFEHLGYRYGSSVAQTELTFSLTGLASAWPEAMGLLADLLRRPALPADQVEPCRQLALQTLDGLDDSPAQKLYHELLQRYFPGPFGRCRYGTRESLAALDHAALVAHAERCLVPGGGLLAVAGGLAAREVIARVEELLGDWTGDPPPGPPCATDGRPAYEHVPSTTEQVHLGVVWPDVPPTDPARYHALMAAQVLSGGMGSRLFTEVREKRGLCYSVHARSLAVPGHGFMMATAGTTTERSSETLAVLLEQIRDLPGTVTEDEIERGRVRLLSSLIMGDESTAGRAGRRVADLRLLGRTRTFEEIRAGLEAVTRDSLNAHLEAHPPSDFTVVSLGSKFDWPTGLTL